MSLSQEAPRARAEHALRDAGLRVTTQRVAVHEALAANPHAPAEQVHAFVRDLLPDIALPTVHAVLSDLTTAGIARRVSLPEAGRALFELDDPARHNHHHIQCVVCNRVEDIPCVHGASPCLTPSDNHGMRVLEAQVTFRGVCAECERSSQ